MFPASQQSRCNAPTTTPSFLPCLSSFSPTSTFFDSHVFITSSAARLDHHLNPHIHPRLSTLERLPAQAPPPSAPLQPRTLSGSPPLPPSTHTSPGDSARRPRI